MALLSKPYEFTFQLIGSYLGQLYTNPLRTKSITSFVIATLGNYTAQRLSGVRSINQDTLVAFGLYGLLFGGSIPHFFFKLLSKIVTSEGPYAPFQMLLIERLLLMPLFAGFSLYTISRMEGKSHDEACKNLARVYFPVVEANFKYLTLFQYLNLYFVPPMLRVLVMNLIGFFWTIYLARLRAGRKNA